MWVTCTAQMVKINKISCEVARYDEGDGTVEDRYSGESA